MMMTAEELGAGIIGLMCEVEDGSPQAMAQMIVTAVSGEHMMIVIRRATTEEMREFHEDTAN